MAMPFLASLSKHDENVSIQRGSTVAVIGSGLSDREDPAGLGG
jgi:hypothetical protein